MDECCNSQEHVLLKLFNMTLWRDGAQADCCLVLHQKVKSRSSKMTRMVELQPSIKPPALQASKSSVNKETNRKTFIFTEGWCNVNA